MRFPKANKKKGSRLGMVYQEYPSHPALKDHVRCYWTISLPSPASSLDGQCFLNEGVECSFILGDPMVLDLESAGTYTAHRSCICGPVTRSLRLRPTGRVDLFGVCFRPGGAYPFFPCPANELVNFSVELDDLWGTKGLEIMDRVRDAGHPMEKRIKVLDRHFLAGLEKKPRCSTSILAALAIMESHQGRVPIDRLAESVGMSIRQLERRFRERVGLSPKELGRILRFKNALKHVSEHPAEGWASTALACGYYDQSHMIRDFQHYVGTSPSAYFLQPQPGARLFTGALSQGNETRMPHPDRNH